MRRRSSLVTLPLLALVAGFAMPSRAQTPARRDPAEFEVVSVRPHTSDSQAMSMVAQPGGRFVAVNMALRAVIRAAYQVQDDQIVDAPEWIAAEHFDIDARADAPGPPGPNLAARLHAMLAQRFGLVVHHDTRELAVYALVRAKRDRTLGPGIRETTCPPLADDLARPERCAGIGTGFGSLWTRGMPLAQFLLYLTPQLNRVIVDRSGLDQRYDIDLKWTPDPRGATAGPGAAATDPNAVSIFTALDEQLGLKLESTHAPVDVLVIDRVERPSPN
jgi:uncharacterized protein (TIGR03435 family)